MKAQGWVLVTGPTSEPLTAQEVREHLRISASDEEMLIGDYIAWARAQAEEHTGRAFITQTWDVHFTGWPSDAKGFEIPLPPLQSVTSIKYTPEGGAQATLSASVYSVLAAVEPGRIILKHDQAWPSETLDAGLPVVVRVVCGWAAADAVPAGIKQGIRWLVGHAYENREAVTMANVPPQKLPMSATWALDVHRFRYW